MLTAVLALLCAPTTDLSLDEIVSRFSNLDRFSGTVYVERSGEVRLSKGYGLANREFAVQNGPQTRFQIGSLSKQFTAAAILHLEAAGKLKVTDRVGDRLKSMAGTPGESVTLHQLLTHTSGIPSLGRIDGVASVSEDGNPKSLEAQIAYAKDLPLQFEPGTAYRYSNTGYTILARVIEEASGKNYRAYITENLLQPLGMKDTGFIVAGEVIPNLAPGYVGYAPDYQRAAYVHPDWYAGAAGMYASAADLAKWVHGLDKVLPPAQLKAFLTEQVPPRLTGRDYGYGYGWFFLQQGGQRLINHGGTAWGAVCELYFTPDRQTVVAALSNHIPGPGVNMPAEVCEAIIDFNLGREPQIPLPTTSPKPELYGRFSARYVLGPGVLAQVLQEGDKLWLQFEGDRACSIETFEPWSRIDRSSDFSRAVREMTEALVLGDFEKLKPHISPERADFHTEERTVARGAMLKPLGRFNGCELARIEETEDGYHVGVLTDSENSLLYFELTLDSSRRLLGLSFRGTPPRRVELLPSGDGGLFFFDGFTYGIADVPVFFFTRNGEKWIRIGEVERKSVADQMVSR